MTLTSLLILLKKVYKSTIESVDRIGRYEENKSQPIKVLFHNKTDQTRVLRNLKTLKQAEQMFNPLTTIAAR